MLQGLSNQAEHSLEEYTPQLPSCTNYTFTPGSIRSSDQTCADEIFPRKLEWLKFAPMHNHTDNCNPRLRHSDRYIRFLRVVGPSFRENGCNTRVVPSMVHSTHHVQGITTHCSQLCCVGPITGLTQSTIPV